MEQWSRLSGGFAVTNSTPAFGLRVADAHTSHRGKLISPGKDRPLIVPVANTILAREGVRLFLPRGPRRLIALVMLRVDGWLPWFGLLEQLEEAEFPLPDAYAELGLSEGSFVVYQGSPGPLSKLSVYTRSPEPSLIKIAMRASADARVLNEAHMLRAMAKSGNKKHSFPCLLDSGRLPSGRYFLRVDVTHHGRRETGFGSRQRAFLEDLQRQRADARPWSECSTYRALVARCSRISTLLDHANRQLLSSVSAEIAAMGGEAVSECVVHGDFAPWNITIDAGRLCVFDWEYGRLRGNPLQDLVHFHLMPRALMRSHPTVRYLRYLGVLAASHLRAMTPAPVSQQLTGALMLQYLADTVTFYAEEDGELKVAHPVIYAYLRLLRERATWLPQAGLSVGVDNER
jgi:hypothetical protein